MNKFRSLFMASIAAISIFGQALAQQAVTIADPATGNKANVTGGALNVNITGGSGGTVAATQSGNWNVGGLTGVGQPGAITRASNTTTYTANTAVCLNTSVTTCVPIQVTIAGANGATGTMGQVLLAKSTATLTNANFTIYFFSAAPTLTSIFDNTVYAGPFYADVTGGTYLGAYTCNAMQVTGDSSAKAFSVCTPTSPQGWMQYKTLTGTEYVDAVIEVTSAYAPGSAEVFTIVANSYQDK